MHRTGLPGSHDAERAHAFGVFICAGRSSRRPPQKHGGTGATLPLQAVTSLLDRNVPPEDKSVMPTGRPPDMSTIMWLRETSG